MAMAPQEQAQELILEVVEHLGDWPLRSAEAFRNAVLGDHGAFAINPMLPFKTEEETQPLRDAIMRVVSEGRMIDFGFLPNELIKQESLRSRSMFEAGEFDHPYQEWLAVSAWEGGMNGYYFSVNPDKPREVLCVEIYGVAAPACDVIFIYDIVGVEARGLGDTLVNPAKFKVDQGKGELEARGANSLDPLVTFLRLLADASIPIIDRETPARLNKQRAKRGEFLIPDHTQVQTRDYVSAFRSHVGAVRTAGKGGTHASPIAHWRRSHTRQLADGRLITVRSSKVNWRATEELHRLFYRVPT
jgi:hypothetical protein